MVLPVVIVQIEQFGHAFISLIWTRVIWVIEYIV